MLKTLKTLENSKMRIKKPFRICSETSKSSRRTKEQVRLRKKPAELPRRKRKRRKFQCPKSHRTNDSPWSAANPATTVRVRRRRRSRFLARLVTRMTHSKSFGGCAPRSRSLRVTLQKQSWSGISLTREQMETSSRVTC